MEKTSQIKIDCCLIAQLKLSFLQRFTSLEDKVQKIESLYQYAVDLYKGISKKNFKGKLDCVFSINGDRAIIYKKLTNPESEELDYEKFLTAVSIFQMVFIDENIYLSGYITKENAYISKDKIIVMGDSIEQYYNSLLIFVEQTLAEKNKNKNLKRINEGFVLDFLYVVYQYNPFKDEKGNMMRHIINPIKIVRKQHEQKLALLIEYCQEYIDSKKYDLTI